MNNFNRLASAWIEWTSLARMPGVSVSTDCADCQINFVAEDQSFHLRRDGDWWIVDRVDDRGKRYNEIAKFSTFDLAEKYLIWRWASFTRTALRLESLGPQFYKQGYSKDVSVEPTESEWRSEIKSPAGSAILSQPDSTIFSHLMSKSANEIEHMIREGIT
jgi:hypothetical protein